MKRILLSIAFVIVAAAGCGSLGPGSHELGAACASDGECQHRCVRDGHFPNGLCTLTCTVDSQCPNGAACVDLAGGICAIQCGAVGGQCGQFGNGFTCDGVDRFGFGGTTSICQVP